MDLGKWMKLEALWLRGSTQCSSKLRFDRQSSLKSRHQRAELVAIAAALWQIDDLQFHPWPSKIEHIFEDPARCDLAFSSLRTIVVLLRKRDVTQHNSLLQRCNLKPAYGVAVLMFSGEGGHVCWFLTVLSLGIFRSNREMHSFVLIIWYNLTIIDESYVRLRSWGTYTGWYPLRFRDAQTTGLGLMAFQHLIQLAFESWSRELCNEPLLA